MLVKHCHTSNIDLTAIKKRDIVALAGLQNCKKRERKRERMLELELVLLPFLLMSE